MIAVKIRKRIETILAFGLLALVLVGSGILTVLDRKGDVYPTGKHKIRLYGEAHGSELYYGIEFHQWQAYYDQGYRKLSVLSSTNRSLLGETDDSFGNYYTGELETRIDRSR